MKRLQFEICQTTIEVLADKDIKTKGNSALFLDDVRQPELTIICDAIDGICPTGKMIGQINDKAAYVLNNNIQRYALNEGRPYAALTYQPQYFEKLHLEVEQEDWNWATDHLRFWITACLPVLLLHFRALIFHASYIDYNGHGILFTAPSGTGKSTQAELWKKYRGAKILNGDKAGISLKQRAMAHGVPFSGTSGICENVSLPLKAIVVLSQASENTVKRLPPSEAVASLCPNVFVDQLVNEEWVTALNLLLDLVTEVPVYTLACTPDVRAVEALVAVLGF